MAPETEYHWVYPDEYTFRTDSVTAAMHGWHVKSASQERGRIHVIYERDGTGRWPRVLAGLVVIVVVVLVAVGLGSPSGRALLLDGEAGKVLFGDSFDPNTFDLHNPRDTAILGQSVPFVAHFSSRVRTSPISLTIEHNGVVEWREGIDVTDPPWDVYAATMAPQYDPGIYVVKIYDIGNNLISEGQINVQRGPASGERALDPAFVRAC